MYYYVLLVDNDDSMRQSLSCYLSTKGFSVNCYKDVHSALSSLRQKIPDIIISDILMPGENGYNLIKLLKKNPDYIHIVFIFLTAKGMTRDRIIGYNLGCHAYLTKPFDPEELVSIMQSLLTSFKLLKKTFTGQSNSSNLRSNLAYKNYQFTYREKTVLELVLTGMMNKEIALQLSLSLRNVEKYVSRLLCKTSTRNRTELVNHFVQLNF